MTLRRSLIVLGVIALMAVGGYAIFRSYAIYVPGVLAEWRNPIAPTQAIAWDQGPAAPATGERPPNIVLILADDLGINDITLTGRGVAGMVPTPNIDRIGHEGVNFVQSYAANATCSPSRAALMTGRYPTRFGFEFTAVPAAFAGNLAHANAGGPYPTIYHEELNKDLPDYPDQGVPPDEITIAETLKQRGYHTIHIGKWHLGEAPALQPNAQGFDESLAILAGGGMFVDRNDPESIGAQLPWDPIDRFIWANAPYAVQWNGGQRFRPKGHVTDYFTDQALAAIEANRNRPFFLYLAHTAPHTPLQALKSDYDALPQIKDHTQRVYGAMLRQLDRRVGDVLAKLEATGLDENTVVIFTSDNGGAWYTGIPDLNAPFRGWKATFFEGGIRVPLMARWPARIEPGTTRTVPTHQVDLFATIAAAGGAPLPRGRLIDGQDLLASDPVREALFWRSGDYRAVRAGDWKLQIAKRPNKAWLFNLAADPTEQVNLAAREPARVAQLRALIERHNAAMPKPLWPGLIEGPVRIDVPLNVAWREDQEYVYWAN